MEPIPVSYTELLPRLIQSQLVARVPLTPMEPPYPRWYDANASCDYHYEIKGHSTKNWLALKNQVQAFKNVGYVNFDYDKIGGPNVISNLLPNHSGPKINGVLESFTEGRKTCIMDVMTPMRVIHEELVQAKVLQSRKRKAVKEESLNRGYCQYHAEV